MKNGCLKIDKNGLPFFCADLQGDSGRKVSSARKKRSEEEDSRDES